MQAAIAVGVATRDEHDGQLHWVGHLALRQQRDLPHGELTDTFEQPIRRDRDRHPDTHRTD